MKKMQDFVQITPGSPQFRIIESLAVGAPLYYFYGQQELENDLVGIELNKEEAKDIHTFDNVNTVDEGDLLFSLISGRATVTGASHNGYLYTQNYVKLVPRDNIEKKYLVYLLNESDYIKRQWQAGLQGTAVLKHTVKQLRELELPKLHSYEKQRVIGDIYFKQLHLQALNRRVADREKILVIEKLKEVKEE